MILNARIEVNLGRFFERASGGACRRRRRGSTGIVGGSIRSLLFGIGDAQYVYQHVESESNRGVFGGCDIYALELSLFLETCASREDGQQARLEQRLNIIQICHRRGGGSWCNILVTAQWKSE